MRLLIVNLILIFCFCVENGFANRQRPNEVEEFHQYKALYNREFDTPEDEFKMMLNFIHIMRTINLHNKLYDMGLMEYGMEINEFALMTPDEISVLTESTRILPFEFEDFIVRPKMVITVDENTFPPGPASINWKAEGHVTPVKDQGYYCNSCWAFSALGALESHLSIKMGITPPVQLSEQYLIDCNRNDETGNWGCQGGNQASSYMFIKHSPGIPSTEAYLYQEDVQHSGVFACRYNRTTSVGTTTGYARIQPQDEEILKNAVANGPVAAAMNASPNSFLFYRRGIYDSQDCTPGTGHSVVIIGYGTARFRSGRTVDFWICKNSWSTGWGDAGFFKIVRGKNMCGITSYLIYPLVE